MPNTIQHTYTADEFAGIFKTYWSRVYAICYRYTSNEGVAKDMVQNIFITLWERREKIVAGKPLEHYLSKAAKYQVFKYIRDAKKRTFIELEEDLMGVDYEDPYEHYVHRELSARIKQRIALLKEPAKTIFILSRYEALTHKQIAGRMGIALKTVEYHLTKAIRFVRKKDFR